MIVQCPKCHQKFRVPDERIQAEGIKVRCGRCQTVFAVRPVGSSQPAVPPAPGNEGAPHPSIPGVRTAPPLDRSATAGPFEQPGVTRDGLEGGSPAQAQVEEPRAAREMLGRPRFDEPLPGGSPPNGVRFEEPGLVDADFGPALTGDDLSTEELLDDRQPVAPRPAVEEEGEDLPPFPTPVSDAFPQAVVPSDALSRWLASALVVLLVLVGFLVFLASRNDWFLDLQEMDQMVASAFKGVPYRPRMVETIRVYDLDGEIIEEPANSAALSASSPLVFQNVRQMLYRTRNQVQLVLVEGDLLNSSSDSYRRILVGGRLIWRGQEIATQVAPVGGTLSPEDLEAVSSIEALEEVYRELWAEVAGLIIQPNQLTRFTLAFVEPEGYQVADGWTYQVEIVGAEHSGEDGYWRRSTFNQSYRHYLDP